MASDFDTIKQSLIDQLKANPEALIAKSISINGKTYVFRDLQDVLDAIDELENKLQRKWRRPILGRFGF